jgi:hypothetical protein
LVAEQDVKAALNIISESVAKNTRLFQCGQKKASLNCILLGVASATNGKSGPVVTVIGIVVLVCVFAFVAWEIIWNRFFGGLLIIVRGVVPRDSYRNPG